jgi:hypothetical protein
MRIKWLLDFWDLLLGLFFVFVLPVLHRKEGVLLGAILCYRSFYLRLLV